MHDEWNGRIILATDNVLEQYQSTIYAFFQGSGQIFVGGIIWSNRRKWIVSKCYCLKLNELMYKILMTIKISSAWKTIF